MGLRESTEEEVSAIVLAPVFRKHCVAHAELSVIDTLIMQDLQTVKALGSNSWKLAQ